MSDFLAVLRWWVEALLASVPSFAAYFAGRWMQRRDDRSKVKSHAHYPVPESAVANIPEALRRRAAGEA